MELPLTFSNTAANLIMFRLVWSIQHLQTTKKRQFVQLEFLKNERIHLKRVFHPWFVRFVFSKKADGGYVIQRSKLGTEPTMARFQ